MKSQWRSVKSAGILETSAASVLWHEALPHLAQRGELRLGEVREEQLADAFPVGLARLGELLAARVGEHGERAAGVVRARLARDQAVALEAIDQAGQAAATEPHRGGDV